MKNYIKELSRDLFLVLIILITGCDQKVKVERPNFIVFIADDISWNDFGCYGNKVVQTPNIDRMATEGVKFTNAYLTTSSCSPSRISIMTGRYPHNTGAAELHTEPTEDFSTIASKLKENGYYTGQAGKWHMGKKIKAGFDAIQENRNKNGDGGEEFWIKSLQNRDENKPFFFWFASHDAHRIWGPNDFSGTHVPDKVAPPITLVNGMDTKVDLAKYYDEIKRFDHYIGTVEEELKNQGVLDNTVIIIMADNGRPFPRDKTRVYDSGVKTPFIVKWPGGINYSGALCHSLMSSIDVAPTILDIGNIDSPVSFQGKSFKVLLNHPEEPFREYVFAEHNWHDFEAHERMVRNSDYLYLQNARPQFANQGPADAIRSPSFSELLRNKDSLSRIQYDIFLAPRPEEELFDIINDSLQINNLIPDNNYVHVRAKLKNVINQWMEETGDNVPANLTIDGFDRTTGIKFKNDVNIRGEMPGTANNAEKIDKKGAF